MGIDLYSITEWNEEREHLYDPKSVLPALLHRSHERDWQILKYIDPYGDTVCNQLQIGTTVKEFSELDVYCNSEEERGWLAAAIALLSRTNETHTYVKMIGD